MIVEDGSGEGNKKIIEKYEKLLKYDEKCNLNEYEKGAHNELEAVVNDPKEVLIKSFS